MDLPEVIGSEEELEEILSRPSPALVTMMKRLDGDIMIAGIAGKMGLTMARRAVHAIRLAGVSKRVIGVARFSDGASQKKLEQWGVETIQCDLLEQKEVASLPVVANLIFMAGRKFGTDGGEDLTWAMNIIAPYHVVEHFKGGRIVAFSTGCVYPLRSAQQGGCDETVAPAPVGEYSQSCLGRERIFQYGAKKYQTKVLLFRLNYAIDLRYGVLHDIGLQIQQGEAVNNSVGQFNVIWQGDANDAALRSLEWCTSPAAILNVTGPETASIEGISRRLATTMKRDFKFRQHCSGDLGYLNDAGKFFQLAGYPEVSLERMIQWQAGWFNGGGTSLGKPTHFEVNNGKF